MVTKTEISAKIEKGKHKKIHENRAKKCCVEKLKIEILIK
jgi:hypothetical protein